jgi:hypothetical protein
MRRTMIVLTADSERRRLLGGVNLNCDCGRGVALREGVLEAWCSWCSRWLHSRCARHHNCAPRRAVHALLDRLVAAA